MMKIHCAQSGTMISAFSVRQKVISMIKEHVFKLILFVEILIQNKENV